MIIKNIFENIPDKLETEFFEDLLKTDNFKLERIVSQAHSSPDGFWYDQDKNEFVLLISGSAELEFEDENITQLKPGDYIIIPSHKKHRLKKTDPDKKTVWLTIHY